MKKAIKIVQLKKTDHLVIWASVSFLVGCLAAASALGSFNTPPTVDPISHSGLSVEDEFTVKLIAAFKSASKRQKNQQREY